MKIFLYDTETTDAIINYESDIIPIVGDFFSGDELGLVYGGKVVERIIHIVNKDVITLRIKLTKL